MPPASLFQVTYWPVSRSGEARACERERCFAERLAVEKKEKLKRKNGENVGFLFHAYFAAFINASLGIDNTTKGPPSGFNLKGKGREFGEA